MTAHPGGGPLPVGGERRLRRMSIPAALACALAAATLVTYVALLDRQGTPLSNPRVAFVAASIAILSLLTGAGALVRSASVRATLLGLATPGLLGVGFIGAWSIGLSLLLAGILAGWAALAAARASALRPLRGVLSGVLITIGVWGVLFIGLLITEPGRP
ncbi:MAG: hypothetical protein ACRDG7_08375 [Candidatus Limnocylindria bacterium]